jgi:hypothetical protein
MGQNKIIYTTSGLYVENHGVILFSLLGGGGLSIKTPLDPEELYDPFIQAFDDALADMATGEDSQCSIA